MKIRRFPIFTSLSILLCLGTLALWYRSYYVCDILTIDSKDTSKPGWHTQWAIASRTGCVDFGRIQYGPNMFVGTLDFLFITTEKNDSGTSIHHLPKPDDDIMNSWTRDPDSWGHLGFHAQKVIVAPIVNMGGVITPDVSGWFKPFPFWFAFLLTTLLPILRIPRLLAFIRSRRRTPHGLCPHCAYDLRVHNTGDKCPECGALIVGKKQA